MRRALPYVVGEDPQKYAGTPMEAPTRAFADHFNGGQITKDIETRGNLALVVPLQNPHDVGTQNGVDPGRPISRGTRGDSLMPSNTVMGGVVKGYITSPDSIRKQYVVALNHFSPTSHATAAARCAASAKIPPPAIVPSKDIGMPPKMGKRGTGGNFTIPYPQSTPQWPTSSQWLASKMRARQV